MKIAGVTFRSQADGSLVCPHRDLFVCPACLTVSETLVDVFGQTYYIPDPAERTILATEMEEVES